jgi:CRP-like cAMP-binding protein
MASEPKSDFEFFRQSPLFRGLTDVAIDRLIDISEITEHGAGDVIVEEGTDGDAIFLLYDGQVFVSIEGDSARIRLATLRNKGAFFGEVAVVDPGPRSATVTAETESVLLSIGLRDLERYFTDDPDAHIAILGNIARVLAQRLRDTNAQLTLFSS